MKNTGVNEMKIIQYLLFTMVLLFASSVGAVPVVVSFTDNWVGAEGTYTYNSNEYTYWAGIVEIEIDGARYLAMPASLDNPFGPSGWDGWSSFEWGMDLYTRDDILAGGTNTLGQWFYDDGLTSSPDEIYSKASQFFLDGLLGYDPADPLWAASFSEMIGQTTFYVPLNVGEREDFFDNANTIYDAASGTRLRDVYNTMISEGLDPNYDYSSFMGILSVGFPPLELLLFTSPVPVPPSLLLFGSGLIGFVAVAKRKRSPYKLK